LFGLNQKHQYGLIEAPDRALRHLAQSPGIKSYGKCIPVMAGESLQGHLGKTIGSRIFLRMST
jgi:hypothetical protein